MTARRQPSRRAPPRLTLVRSNCLESRRDGLKLAQAFSRPFRDCSEFPKVPGLSSWANLGRPFGADLQLGQKHFQGRSAASFCTPNQMFFAPSSSRHRERSASRIYHMTESLWRGVEGPRRCLLTDALQSFPATKTMKEIKKSQPLGMTKAMSTLSKDISRKGPRNCRSLGFARSLWLFQFPL
jgi:hypothetical protein